MTMMKSFFVLFFLCLNSRTFATRDPATGYYLGKKPTDSWISTVSAKHNSDVQAAECSHNTRMSHQTFAWFEIDPKKIDQNGSTYGTCYATTTVPSTEDLEADSGFDVFYWENSGGHPGDGTGSIRDPNNGTPGYEDNSGAFHPGNPPDGESDPNGGDKSSSPSGDDKTGGDKTGGDKTIPSDGDRSSPPTSSEGDQSPTSSDSSHADPAHDGEASSKTHGACCKHTHPHGGSSHTKPHHRCKRNTVPLPGKPLVDMLATGRIRNII